MSEPINVEPPCKKPCLDNNSKLGIDKYADVGIEEFFDSGVGFFGKIKERWEDFVVNEIDLDGNIITLTNLDLPESNNKSIIIENKHIEDSVINDLDNLISSPNRDSVQFDAPEDKVKRTEIYNFIKSKYPSLYGNTEVREGKRVFVITNYEDERSQIAKRNAKISGDDDYCQFVLYKEGKDTIAAIGLIAKYLKMKPAGFSYAGTKDRRGITTQLVRVRGCAANRLKGLNKCLTGIVLGNFSYVSSPLKLGDLFGNRFSLVIRAVEASDADIESAIERFRRGSVNYYGLQRFGSTDIRSHDIGKLAIGSRWQDMIRLILQPTPQDLPHMRDCKSRFQQTGDCDAFLQSASSGIERSLVSGVKQHGYSLNALDSLPRNLRQLYVHSYQSYVWNTIVSQRIRDCGSSTVLEGDLVECPDGTVTRIEAAQIGQFTIADVVLPLSGYDVLLPDNRVADWYRDLLSKDGLSMDQLRHRVKDFSLPGSYRKLVVVPTDLQYSIHNYTDPAVPLIETDRHKMTGEFLLPKSEGPLKAVRIEFTLPKSAYATIAMRELMKTIQVIQ